MDSIFTQRKKQYLFNFKSSILIQDVSLTFFSNFRFLQQTIINN